MGWFDKKKEGSKYDAWIGERIRTAREEKGWTQQQLAKKVYKSQGNISDYERGRLEISAVDLMLIALALEKPITFFFLPTVSGVTQGDLTDKEKELIHYTLDLPDEMFELLLDQAKKYREITYNKVAERNRKDIAEERQRTREERKKKPKK
jgi:transcriptional regulator with XRE-family HTH domain